MNYKLIEGDLFDSDAKYLAHQCNCISVGAFGIAKVLFEKYSYADIYISREGVPFEQLPLSGEEPGNIVIKGNGVDERYIINMLAQFWPGGVRYPYSAKDGYIARQRYFKDCLLKITKIEDLESIAFPYKIGCGIAGGNWEIYEKLIDIFASKVKADVYVYRFES